MRKQEISISVPGYGYKYSVTTLGRVINDHTGKVMKLSNNRGYQKVNLTKDGITTTHRVHRLVAMAFISNPDEYPEVDHRDEDKANNCIDNLRWCTGQMNKNYFNGREEFASKIEKVTVYGDREAFIEATGKGIVVNGFLYGSCGEAARMIAEAEAKNKATVSKELRRMLQGKRAFGCMYSRYNISKPNGEPLKSETSEEG